MSLPVPDGPVPSYHSAFHEQTPPTGIRPDRNLALELVRVTEAGAMAAAGGSAGVTRTAATARRSTRCGRSSRP